LLKKLTLKVSCKVIVFKQKYLPRHLEITKRVSAIKRI